MTQLLPKYILGGESASGRSEKIPSATVAVVYWLLRPNLVVVLTQYSLPIIRRRSSAYMKSLASYLQEEVKARERATTRKKFLDRARKAEERSELREAKNKRRVSQRKALRILEIRERDKAARNIQVSCYTVDYRLPPGFLHRKPQLLLSSVASD